MEKMTRKKANDLMRTEHLRSLVQFLEDGEHEVLYLKSNQICYPVVNANGDEEFIKIVMSVPNGSKDENGFDGYGEAESFAMAEKEKEEKRAAAAEAKAKKIAKDKARREEAKARREAEETKQAEEEEGE